MPSSNRLGSYSVGVAPYFLPENPRRPGCERGVRTARHTDYELSVLPSKFFQTSCPLTTVIHSNNLCSLSSCL